MLMLRIAIAIFMIGGMAWGQAQTDTSKGADKKADKVDRASSYYHYALAHLYAEMAASSQSRNREYQNKAIENYRAAVKADPQTPMMLQGPLAPVVWLPVGQPSRALPKDAPSSRQRP